MDQRRKGRKKKRSSNNPIKNIDGGLPLNIDERLDFLLDYKTNFLDGCNAHSGSIKRVHGILFPKLFCPSVRKKCSSDRELFL